MKTNIEFCCLLAATSVLVGGGIPRAQAQSFLTNGLVAYYPFNGDANDASGNGFNGTVVAATLITNRLGEPNSAYYFNGTNSQINLPQSLAQQLAGTNPVSVSAWFQTDQIITNHDMEFVAFGAEQQTGGEAFAMVCQAGGTFVWSGWYAPYVD